MHAYRSSRRKSYVWPYRQGRKIGFEKTDDLREPIKGARSGIHGTIANYISHCGMWHGSFCSKGPLGNKQRLWHIMGEGAADSQCNGPLTSRVLTPPIPRLISPYRNPMCCKASCVTRKPGTCPNVITFRPRLG